MKNKIKKIIPYFLILLALAGVGLFGLAGKASAQGATGICWKLGAIISPGTTFDPVVSSTQCATKSGTWQATGTPEPKNPPDLNGPITTPLPGTPVPIPTTPGTPSTSPATPPQENTGFLNKLPDCGVILSGTLEGCLVKFSYLVFFALPSAILALTANLFNSMLGLTLGTTLYSSTFISEGWGVVRDLANLFFILILLYIAIKIILGIGGSDVKKMIVQVIIMALLINFSMFMTKVVIDTSNILALIFYNKIIVNDVRKVTYQSTFDSSKTGVQEKDIGGAIAGSFNPLKFVGNDFFIAAETQKMWMCINPRETFPICPSGPMYTTNIIKEGTTTSQFLSIIFVGGVIFLFASYAFFVAGLSFLARLIELWVLIIFSPFAFMSSSIPLLSSIEYLGWDAWLKRLLKVAFMAPIFMFFLYLISKLIQIPFWNDLAVVPKDQGFIAKLLLVAIPAAIVLTLLLKAAEFAKKGSGQIGEAVFKGAKMVGGLALGAATGGAALLGTGALGSLAAKAASSKGLQDAAKEKGMKGRAARMALRSADYGSRASFDVRSVPGIGSLAKAGGLDIGKAREGGYEKRRADKVKKRQERAKQLEVREDETLKQGLNAVEGDLQELLGAYSHDINQLDKRIKAARQNKSDLVTKSKLPNATEADVDAAKEATDKLEELKAHKKAIKSGKANFEVSHLTDDTVAKGTKKTINFVDKKTGLQNNITREINGKTRSINDMEDEIIPEAEHKIEQENIRRKRDYADRSEKKWLWRRTNKEAAHKIRMGAKLDSGTKEGSH